MEIAYHLDRHQIVFLDLDFFHRLILPLLHLHLHLLLFAHLRRVSHRRLGDVFRSDTAFSLLLFGRVLSCVLAALEVGVRLEDLVPGVFVVGLLLAGV